MKKNIIAYMKKEIVLSIAVILAIISMFFVHPDQKYLSYIDLRTLAILFSLMAIVAGFKKLGILEWLAEKLLSIVKTIPGMALILVFLCFFCSMLITNDVALITFVPFTITLMGKMDVHTRKYWMYRLIVMQTIAANLGSMFTPIGNPQNLYLSGKTGLSFSTFLTLMLPYTALSGLLLLLWIMAVSRKSHALTNPPQKIHTCHQLSDISKNSGELTVYLILLFICLLAVGHILPYPLAFTAVLIYMLAKKRNLFLEIDYSLLGTFAALFIFIGNLGRIPAFCTFLKQLIHGREVLTAVLASQVMSNVPAAILLSGFTTNIKALIVGTNLGGLGTLIASMASLISFKYVAAEKNGKKGHYLTLFSVANLIFLAFLSCLYAVSFALF